MTTSANGRERLGSRDWADEAVRRIEADANRSADTHLHPFPLPEEWGIDLYLKDESVHPTGSLKHRLARSLFLYGLCNGWITERTTIVEASSGSTAVSEAYFARFLGLPFVAVMPASTSPEKIALIEAQGGSCHLVDDPSDDGRRGAAAGGRARRALPRPVHLRRARDGLARQQQHRGVDLQPDGAGAAPGARVDRGGRRNRRDERDDRPLRPPRCGTPRSCASSTPRTRSSTRAWAGDPSAFTGRPSRIEGIGRQRVEPSFLPDIVDRMIQVPDAASIATMRLVRERTGRSVGGSTGTNVWGALLLVAEMLARGERGSVVTLICDGGDRYAGTYYSDAWVGEQGLELAPYTEALETFLECGAFPVSRVGDLDLGDHAVDLVHDLGRNLVHPVGVARVGR